VSLVRSLAFFVTLIVVAVAFPIIEAPRAEAQNPVVVINEFLASNNNGIADNTGAFEDWIELHNTSGSAVQLNGWTLADGDATYTFVGASIPANGYLLLFASGEPARTTSSQIHLPFKLAADGEPLLLRTPTGTLSNPAFPAPGYPALPADVSYGRSTNGLGFYTSPTPGSSNSGASQGLVAPVTFSVDHGFYDTAQTVILNTATPGATIRYTLNNSTPTPTNGTVLAPGQPITISTTSTVRAVAYRAGWITSSTKTRSYLFASDIINQSTSTPPGWPNSSSSQSFSYGMDPNIVNGNEAAVAASLTSIPSLSIVTDQANLTNGSTGIYVNAFRSGRDWERPASVELIDPSGAEPGFEINAGLRIRGGGSRNASNPKHSLRLYFRDDYGDGELDYPLFGPDGVDRFESLGLATGQNGSWAFRGEEDATWVRDPWVRATQGDMGQPNTDSRYYHLYLNGQYWGLYYSQERLSGAHGVEHFGGNEGDYDVVGGNWRAAGTASDGNVDGLRALYPLVQDLNVTDSEFATLEQQVDLENLADYFLLHYFSGDYDASPMGWPDPGARWAESNNWRAVRNRSGVGQAGKWLFFDHDSEFTLCGLVSSVDLDNTTPWNLNVGRVPNHQVTTPAWLHEALLTHPTYRQIFRDSVSEHLQTPGGALTDAANQARFDTVIAEVTGAIDGEAARWGDALGDPANDRNDWNANIAEMRQCATDRQTALQAQLEADGLWPNAVAPTITPASGAVPYGTDVSIQSGDLSATIFYTTDGTDPRSSTGAVSSTATEYGGPLSITEATTVRARARVGTNDWAPLAEATYTLSTPAGPVTLLLNEYNAVSGSKYLGGGLPGDVANGSDETFGRVAGNGGDWFELVVLEDIDISGWTFEVWHIDNTLLERSAALTVATGTDLGPLRRGTILTISEDIADDTSWDPRVNDWHINLQANNANEGAYFTAASQQNFAIDNNDTQIAIFDATGAPVALRSGEGTVDGVSVSSEEVFKLEAAPDATITFDSASYNDGKSSTWGLPNRYAGGQSVQDFGSLRYMAGDADCDQLLTIGDALVIAQYTVSIRNSADTCDTLDPATEIMIPAADVDASGVIDIGDALLIAQCTVGLVNDLCS